MNLYPLKLKPVTKNALWGGNRINYLFDIGDNNETIAEAWMMTSRPDDCNIIENGEAAGLTLKDYVEKIGKVPIYGKHSEFPLLIKIIDANDKLSVQVHPDDIYAKANNLDAGKTEMWYIIDCASDATLVYGLSCSQAPSLEELQKRKDNGSFDEILNYVSVKPGDCFYIPAGLVHAIGKGILIAEIQQNSNTTYRLYDYNRLDKDAKPRALHLKNASEVIKTQFSNDACLNIIKTDIPDLKITTLCDCPFFSADKYRLSKNTETKISSGIMKSVLCLNGSGKILCQGKSYALKKGDSYLLPAKLCDATLTTNSNVLEVIISNAK